MKHQLIKYFFAIFLRVFIHSGFFENHLLGINISNTITVPAWCINYYNTKEMVSLI